jgi:type IV pilus assembly protein PilO
MLKSFSLPSLKGVSVKDPRVLMRAILGVLLAVNLVAAVAAFRPFGGSAEDLMRQEDSLRRQLQELTAKQARTRSLVDKVQQARAEGERFLAEYVLDRRTTMSTLEEELTRAAKEAGMKAGQTSFVLEPIEGSDTLSMLTITAGFEGNYSALTKLVNMIDKSPRFLILENMVAAPQVGGGQNLNVSLKLDVFVRDAPEGGAL